MLRKKGKVKEARVDTQVAELTEKETLMHYNAVLIEDMNSKFKLVLEGLDVLSGKVDVLTDRVDRVEGRLSTLELALRSTKDDMVDMERRISSKLNRLIERSDNHEYRISALEA